MINIELNSSGSRYDKTPKKSSDSAQFLESNGSSHSVQLQDKIKLLQMDYKTLHDKRLQDVNYFFFPTK